MSDNSHNIVRRLFCPICGEEAEIVSDDPAQDGACRQFNLECRGTCPVIEALVIIPIEVYDLAIISRSNWAKARNKRELVERLDKVLRDLKTLIAGEL